MRRKEDHQPLSIEVQQIQKSMRVFGLMYVDDGADVDDDVGKRERAEESGVYMLLVAEQTTF